MDSAAAENSFTAATASVRSIDCSVSAISTNTPSIDLDDDVSVIHAARPQVPLDALPVELLSQIVRHLPVVEWPSVELLSRGLRNGTHAAWKSLTAIDIEKSVFPVHTRKFPDHPSKLVKFLKKLIARSPDLAEIKGIFVPDDSETNDDLCDLLTKFGMLEKINFGETTIDAVQLAKVLRDSSSRQFIEEIDVRKSMIDDRQAVERNEPQQHVALSDGFGILATSNALRPTMLDFELNVAKLPFDFLASIDSSRLTSFLVRGSVVPQKFLAEFLRRSPRLEYVSFDFSNYYDRNNVNHDLDFANRVIRLAANKDILEAIERMDQLKSLDIMLNYRCAAVCECKKFEREFDHLCHVLANRPSFIAMSVGEQLAQPPFVRSIAPILPNLKKFKLLITELDATTMSSMLRSQSSLNKLFVYADSAAIGDMIGNKASMQKLSIRFPQKVPTREELLELSSFENLRELRLRVKGENIDDSVLKTWASSFGSNLVKFEMEDCRKISSEAIVQFVAKCPKLDFFVVQNSSITDDGLRQIASQSPKIKVLVLQSCEKISIDGLQAIVDGLESLENLHYRAEKDNSKMLVYYPWALRGGKYRMISYHSKYVTNDHWK